MTAVVSQSAQVKIDQTKGGNFKHKLGVVVHIHSPSTSRLTQEDSHMFMANTDYLVCFRPAVAKEQIYVKRQN